MATTSGAENIRLGSCRVIYDDRDLGLTIGGVEVTVTTTTHQTKVDQFGETLVEETVTGRNILVKAPLAETTLENMASLMPGAELVVDGEDKAVVVKTGIGLSLIQSAKPLRLHPVHLPEDDKSEDLLIPLAGTAGAINFAYKVGEERVYASEFNGYPDANGVLFVYGDDAVTI